MADFDDKIDGSSTPNSDHLEELAAGIKSLSLASDASSKAALEAVQKTRDEISLSAGDLNSNSLLHPLKLTEDDVESIRESFVSDAVSRLDLSEHPEKISQERVRQAVADVVGSMNSSLTTAVGSRGEANSVVPTIDYALLAFDQKISSRDGFYVKLVISIPNSMKQRLKLLRIFRSMSDVPDSTRIPNRLSFVGVGKVAAFPNTFHQKNRDSLALASLHFSQRGVDTVLSSLTPIDGFTGVRKGSSQLDQQQALRSSEEIEITRNTALRNDQLSMGTFDPELLRGLDQSVVKDLNTLRLLKDRFPGSVPTVLNDTPQVGSSIIEKGNSMGIQHFSEVSGSNRKRSNTIQLLGSFSPSVLSSRTIGDLFEMTVFDTTVEYGESYRYYVTTVDERLNESVRSEIVQVDVEHLELPEPPQLYAQPGSKFASLTAMVSDVHVEKIEIYRKEVMFDENSFVSREVATAGGIHGFPRELMTFDSLENGFVQVAELSIDKKRSSTFIDREIVPGRKYVYRAYSVDVFGNKSESPSTAVVYIKDQSCRPNDLRKPSITTEIDGGSHGIRVTMSCDDDRIVALKLSRRENSTKETAYHSPTDPARCVLGARDAIRVRSMVDPFMNPGAIPWSGVFPLDKGRKIVFLDSTVSYDRTYQYEVVGVDLYGQSTSLSVAPPTMVVRRPLVNSPVALSATLVFSEGSHVPSSVRLTWGDGNLNIQPSDRLGDRNQLSASIVRSLFQVERKRFGQDRWEIFPMVEELELTDPISSDECPQYRPPYLRAHSTYSYRVIAFQSGSFYSNNSDEIVVSTDSRTLAPENVRIRSCDTKLRPFFVAVNWDTPEGSGPVDRWEIQRAAVNNFAAQRMNVRNLDEVSSLQFFSTATVYLESSRGRSRHLDDREPEFVENVISGSNVKPILTGQHHYIDHDVSFGNSYFYRIRAVGPSDQLSDWVTRGISIRDPSFDAKLEAIISPQEKQSLALDRRPLSIRGDFIK